MSSTTTSQINACQGCLEGFRFRIFKPEEGQPMPEGFVIEARQVNDASSCKPKDPVDLQFNLSTVLGNNNGQFEWGRMDFQNTGTDFTLCETTGVLRGKLLNLAGVYVEQTIPLHEKLHVESYVERTIRKDIPVLHHKLKQIKPHDSRTLILCFDGTSHQFGIENTNVVRLVELLRKDDPASQMVYYQTGVGTYAPPGLMTPVGLKVASVIDQGVAWYLYQHIIDGYKYLMQTYRAGDRIALFGFSRGAFTARALAGMLHCVGLLPAHNAEHVPFAYEVYRNAQDHSKPTPKKTGMFAFPWSTPAEQVKPAEQHLARPGSTPAEEVTPEDYKRIFSVPAPKKKSMFTFPWSEPAEGVKPEDFKRVFSVPVVIDFVGVWDTVASMGAISAHDLPWVSYNPSILVFRQALALDERRGSFIPSLWNHSLTDQRTQDVREVWFRGEHADVGGGSPDLDANPGRLSDISLRWMIRQIIDSKAGLWFDHIAVHDYWKKGIIEQMRPRNEDEPERGWVERVTESIKLDLIDINNKPFPCSKVWTVLEYLAFNSKLKNSVDFNSAWTRWPNQWAPRSIYAERRRYPIFVHSSVVDFMLREQKAGTSTYTPRAIWHYHEDRWPRIEDVLPPDSPAPPGHESASLKPNAEIPLVVKRLPPRAKPNTQDPQNGEVDPLHNGEAHPDNQVGRWTVSPVGAKFIGCVLVVMVWLSLLSVIPKFELTSMPSSLEIFFKFGSLF